MSLRRKIFYGFTFFVIALLLLLPATSWLARKQLFSSWHRSMVKNFESVSRKSIQKVAENYPNDFETQFAYAMNADGSEKRIASLEALDEKFPHNPVVIASLLRVMTSQQVHLTRLEEVDWLNNRKSTPVRGNPGSNDPAHVARFIAFAEEGEQLQPVNAYFPMMATIGYLVANKDEQAVATWVRASKKTDWDDYSTQEITAKWKLYQAANGGLESGSQARYFTKATILSPHLAPLRRAAVLILVKAVKAEQAGNKEVGFQLRQATRQNGQRMLHAKSAATATVGQNFTSLSAVRPGGIPAQENPYKGIDASDRWYLETQNRYKAYLLANGHRDEAAAFAQAISQRETLKKLQDDGYELTYYGFGKKTYDFISVFVADSLLLTGVLFALAFAVIFKLVYRFSPRLRKGEPLQHSAQWGVNLAFLIPNIISSVILLSGIYGIAGFWLRLAGCILFGFLLVVLPRFMRVPWRQIGHSLFVMLATMTALAGLVGVGWVAHARRYITILHASQRVDRG